MRTSQRIVPRRSAAASKQKVGGSSRTLPNVAGTREGQESRTSPLNTANTIAISSAATNDWNRAAPFGTSRSPKNPREPEADEDRCGAQPKLAQPGSAREQPAEGGVREQRCDGGRSHVGSGGDLY